MKKMFLMLTMIGSLLFSETLGTEQVGHYKNSRFGFSLQYPGDLLTEKTYPENGDGVWLKNKAGTVELVPNAGFVFDISNIKQMYQEALQSHNEEKGIEVTYKVQKKNWYVLSGYNHNNKSIFYKKYYLINDVSSGFTISYPIKDKKKYSQLIKLVSKSFKPSKGEYYEEENNQQKSPSRKNISNIEIVKAEDLVAFPNDYAYNIVSLECGISSDTTITYRDDIRSYDINLNCGNGDLLDFSSSMNLAMNLDTVTTKNLAKWMRSNEGKKCIVTGKFKSKNISGASLQLGTTLFKHTLFINEVNIVE